MTLSPLDRQQSREDRWSQGRFQEMAKLWDLSEKDRRKMRELEQRLEDIHHQKNDPFEVARFYKEYKGKIQKVEKSFRSMIQWRIDENVDGFLDRYGAPDPLFQQSWPTAVLNTLDKDGDPIYFERFGKTDLSGFLKTLGSDAMTEYSATYLRELFATRSFWKPYEDQAGRRVRQFTMIVDLDGATMDLLRPSMLSQIQRVAHICQTYYPGWGKRVILLNAPKFFKYGFSFVKSFLDQSVQDKLVVTTKSDYLQVLEQYISLDNLPPCIYPQGHAKGLPGYCEQVSLEGGPLKGERSENSQKRPLLARESSGSSVSLSCDSDFSERTNVSAAVLIKGVWGEALAGGDLCISATAC